MANKISLYVVYGMDVGTHGLVGVFDSENKANKAANTYNNKLKKVFPFVSIREVILNDIVAK